jgi:putative SOS response-associated peptidase YedK
MCGRLVVATPSSKLVDACGAERATEERSPRYNLAPTQEAPAVLNRDRATLRWIRWGLIPSWAQSSSIGAKLFNARCETAPIKRAFRDALAKRRCVIVSDGFYEWDHGAQPKQPWFIYRADKTPMLLAGIWDVWRERANDREWITFAILTTAPNDAIRPLHDRMPVVLEPSALDDWLDPNPRPPDVWSAVFAPCPTQTLARHPVSTRVNSVTVDDPSCLTPVIIRPQPQLNLF